MTPPRKAGELLLPWSGWIAAFAGWGLTHQVGSLVAQDKCSDADPLLMLLIGLAGLALAGAGALLSLKLWRRGTKESATRRFLAVTGMMLVALLGAAILWQTIGSVLVPRCFA